MALTRRDRPGVVIPKLGNDVDFEIKSQFLNELRCNLFACTDDEDAHEHVRRVLDITDLFHIPGVTRRVLDITDLFHIPGVTRSISTWDHLEKAFISQYCPPLKTAKKLEEIQKFKQGMDETLYQAWERYKDLQFRCPQHYLNNHKKVHIFYKGLDIPSRKMVDSQGLIPMMPPAQALKSIQNMAGHLQNWYNEATTWHGSSNNSNDITNITKRIDNLEFDIQKLQENMHAIQVGCKIYEEVHLTQVRSLNEDDKDDMDMRLRMIDAATKNLQGKSEKLTQEILTSSMADEVKAKIRNEMKVKKEPIPFDLPNINQYGESTIPPIQLPGHVKEQEDEAQAFRMHESLKKLKINRSLIRAVKRMPEYLMYVKDVFSSKKPIVEMDALRLNDRCTDVLQNQLPPRENDPGSSTLPCLIGSSNIRSALADLGASINVRVKSKKASKGIIENVLVQINKFIFPVDFVVIDMLEDHNVPLILGRPFLETAHAHIDVFNRHISLGVGEERVSFEITEPMDDPYINYESVCMIECSRKTHEEELELLLANDTQSSFTKMKEQSCIVNTNEKYEPFIQQLNPFSGISHSSKSSIKMGKKGGEITSPPRYDSNLSFFYLEESLRTPDVSCYLPLYFISSEGIDTSVLGKSSRTKLDDYGVRISSYGGVICSRKQTWSLA
ncbi:hypothetical protein Tco_1503943 [Tanacetum coccineum]